MRSINNKISILFKNTEIITRRNHLKSWKSASGEQGWRVWGTESEAGVFLYEPFNAVSASYCCVTKSECYLVCNLAWWSASSRGTGWWSSSTYVRFETLVERMAAPSPGEISSCGIANIHKSKPNHQVSAFQGFDQVMSVNIPLPKTRANSKSRGSTLHSCRGKRKEWILLKNHLI